MESNPLIQFTIQAKAETAGSKRAFALPNGRNIIVDDNPKSRDWKLVVATYARSQYDGPLLTKGVGVEFTFVRPRPKCDFGSGKNSHIVKASSDKHAIKKPDVLKLARAVEDALTKVIWADDAQICDERLLKVFGDSYAVRVKIWELP